MENIELIENADATRWKDAVHLTNEHEGWVLAHEDFDRWSNGFGKENFNLLVAVDKNTKKTLGHVATAYYESVDGSEPLLTVGMFFVVPELRGTGLGLEVFSRVLKNPRFEDVNWALNGVPAMTRKYASRYGFDKYPDWQIANFEARVADIDCSQLEDDPAVVILPVGHVNADSLVEYDTQLNGNIRRDGFLHTYLQSPNAFSRVAVDSQGQIVGVGNIRVGVANRLCIGPLYGDSPVIIETLLKAIIEDIPNLESYSKIWMFPASTNTEAKNIFFKLAGNKAADHGVMYGQFTNRIIKVDTSKVFSVTEYAMSYC